MTGESLNLMRLIGSDVDIRERPEGKLECVLKEIAPDPPLSFTGSLSTPPSSRTGFSSLIKMYQISGTIERTAHNIQFLKKYNNSLDEETVVETIEKLDRLLSEWASDLPSDVSRKFLQCLTCSHRPTTISPSPNSSHQHVINWDNSYHTLRP